MGWNVAGNIRGPQGPQGIQGPQGPQGGVGPAGPAGLTWRGAWANANAYAVNDAVGWGGSTYFATAPHAANANQPPTGVTADPGVNDAAVNAGWALLATEGAAGPQGPQGPAGAAGAPGVQGIQGPQGQRGTNWYSGHGVPGVIAGSLPNDKYTDLDTGDVYTLT